MSNTDLYYAKLTDLSVRIRVGIDNRREPLNELTQALDQLSQTNAIKGNAADAMKAYIGEVHMTLIQTLGLILYNYEAALDNYVIGYLGVDSDKSFQFVKEDLDDHERKLSSHRSDFTSFGSKLKAISDEAEDIISLSGAGSRSIVNVVSEMDAMKKTVSNLKENWNNYDNSYRGFNQVQDLITQTISLLNSTLSVPRGYSYSPGSFRNLMSKNFVDALIANANYAQNPANQKVFNANRNKILKNYKADQKRMADIRKEANRHKGAWEVVFGVGAAVIGVVAIVATAGAATPLVAVACTAGFSAIAYGTSNAVEGGQIMVTGADKAFNPLRDTIFQGNQSAYDTFGNVAVFVAGSVVPVGAALKAGEPVTRAFIAGVGRTSVTTAVGVGTNFVVAPIVTSLAKSAGIDPIVANDIGIGTGFATSIFTAGKAYKVCGDGAEVHVADNAFEGGKYSAFGEMSDKEGIIYSNWMKVREGELYTDYVKAGKQLGVKLEADGYKIIKTEDATIANADWYDLGFDKPPVAENTMAYTVEAGDYSYSRVYLEGYNNPMSSFIVRTDEIAGLSAKEITQKLALSKVPNKVVTVDLPPTTPLEVSIVGPQPSWGTIGGDVQFAIKDVDLNPNWFTNISDLK